VLASSRPLRWRSYVPAVLVLVVGLCATWAAFLQVNALEYSRAELTFADAARDRILVVRRELRDSLEIVQDLGSFFEIIDRVGRRQFREYVQPVLRRDPSIRFLAWAPRVTAAEREEFLARERRVFPPLRIHSSGVASSATDVEQGSVLDGAFPLLYLQPYQPGMTPLGLDLASLPVEAVVLERAADSGQMQVLEHPSALPGGSGVGEFEVYFPVFRREWADGNGVEQALPGPERYSRDALRGYAIGRFVVASVIDLALSNLSPIGIDMRFSVDTGDGGQQLLYWHSSRTRPQPLASSTATDAGWKYSGEIAIGDHHWRVLCTPVAGRFEPEAWGGWVVLGSGLAITLLIAGYLLTLERRSARIKRLVSQRTAELEVINAELSEQIANRVHAEQALQRLNATLEQRVAQRTSESERRAAELEQFAYVASHDLKAPLRAIANLAEWLEEDLAGKLTSDTREQMKLLRDRVARMHALIVGLLTYSRVGHTAAALSEVDSAELVAQTLDSLAPPPGFEFVVEPGMPVLTTDRMQLGQVFANLISNGIKHHHHDHGRICISGREVGDHYEFSVSDDGPGIASEYHNKVFRMFQTLRVSDLNRDTGVGLALVKKIVEEHGGHIELRSAPGKGSTFRFSWGGEGADAYRIGGDSTG